MKTFLIAVTVAFACIGTTFAGFSKSRLESAKSSATRSGKLIAFVFYQDYYDPNCPKCIQDVDSNNNGAKKALPRADVVVVEVQNGDKNLDQVPGCVGKGGATPRVVITDAKCEKVIASYQGAPNRDQEKAMQQKVDKARLK